MASGSGNVVDEKFDPLIRQVAIRLANKVPYLPKFVISRLPDDELYELLGKKLSNLNEGEADRILEAELQTMFAPLGAVLSFLFPRTNRITPPKPPVPEPQILEPVALKDFIIYSILYAGSVGFIYYGGLQEKRNRLGEKKFVLKFIKKRFIKVVIYHWI